MNVQVCELFSNDVFLAVVACKVSCVLADAGFEPGRDFFPFFLVFFLPVLVSFAVFLNLFQVRFKVNLLLDDFIKVFCLELDFLKLLFEFLCFFIKNEFYTLVRVFNEFKLQFFRIDVFHIEVITLVSPQIVDTAAFLIVLLIEQRID